MTRTILFVRFSDNPCTPALRIYKFENHYTDIVSAYLKFRCDLMCVNTDSSLSVLNKSYGYGSGYTMEGAVADFLHRVEVSKKLTELRATWAEQMENVAHVWRIPTIDENYE